MADLHAFAEHIWIVDGPSVRDMGVMFTTRMTVVKLCEWLTVGGFSCFCDPLKRSRRVTELGPLGYLVAATPRHVWRLAAWHTLFPEAQLWAPRPTPFTLKKGPLPYTGILGDEPPQAWKNDFDQLAFRGNPLIEEVLFFHKLSRTVILDDLIQVHPRVEGKHFRNALFKLEGVVSPHGGVGLDIRLSFIRRNLARQSLQKLLSWDFDKLIIAHGPCVEKDAKAFVKRAFRWLSD